MGFFFFFGGGGGEWASFHKIVCVSAVFVCVAGPVLPSSFLFKKFLLKYS